MEYTPVTPETNTSGQGSTAIVPPEIRGWNWGAFLMSWIWSIGHQTWIGLLALLPYVGIIMAIILGMKGSDWAWQNRRWESVEQFRQVQKIWMYWGIGIIGGCFLLGIVAAVLFPIIIAASRAAHGG